MYRSKIRTTALFVFAMLVAVLQAQTATETSEHSADVKTSNEQNLASLEMVFETVRDTAWDDDFDLESWTTQRDKARAKIKDDTSKDELRDILNGMLTSLEKSHFGVLPATLYETWEENQSTDQDSDVGIQVRLVEGRVLVSDVREESAAHEQGVKLGWEFTKFNDKSLKEFVDRMSEALPKESQTHLTTMAAFAIGSKLTGEEGSEVTCEFADGDDKSHTLKLKRSKMRGDVVAIANLPPMVVDHEAREISDGIGYLAFNGFFAPVQIMADLNQAIEIAAAGKGLIIDLRGNGGGLAGMTMGIGNKLVTDDEQQFLGTLKTKDTTLKFVLIPQNNAYNGPVAVLIDECSASASEILSGGLQAIKRARIFGTSTPGMALPSMVKEMPNKDRLQFAFASYLDSADRCLEGEGVHPDAEVPLTRSDLLAGKDAVLDAAVEWIQQQTK